MINSPKEVSRFSKIVDEIMSSSDAVRRVLVIDENGNEAYTKATPATLIEDGLVRAFARDMHFLRGMLGLYDDVIGENVFTHLIRTKGQMLIFTRGRWTFFLSCERERSRHEVAEISDRVERIICDRM